MNLKTLIPPAEKTGERLDIYLSQALDITRSQVQDWLKRGFVQVSGIDRAKNYRLRSRDEITVQIPEPVSCEAKAQFIALDIVYEDSDLLVVNKKKGMVVHPAVGNRDGTLVNALLAHCGDSLSGIGGVLRPGIVHRIDKDTSGLLIVAKNDISHHHLAKQIKTHSFLREYQAVVTGRVKDDKGTIDAPIGRHPVHRKRMAVLSNQMVTAGKAKNAVTHYEVIARYAGFTHVRLRLETGRTHQIRVHMSYLGYPVAGDIVYGTSKLNSTLQNLKGQCLHAYSIGFVHPRDGRWMEFVADLPAYFKDFLNKLGQPI